MSSQFTIDPNTAYDVVELPSQGIYYTNRKKSLRIAYLTASDENILASASLHASNKVIDEILKRKILDKDFNIDELVEEDQHAILIFLRNTAFGGNYKVSLKDPKTQEDFNFEIDLTTLKVKDFNLKEDENGEYSYFLKSSKVNITFKFITKAQLNELDIISNTWNGIGVAPIVTRRLEMMIKSIDGNKDQLFIRNFILNMPIKDSQDFRKYVNENKPGLDLTQTVKTPSGDTIQVELGFGVEFFRPFYGV
jgi:hypothetical protein